MKKLTLRKIALLLTALVLVATWLPRFTTPARADETEPTIKTPLGGSNFDWGGQFKVLGQKGWATDGIKNYGDSGTLRPDGGNWCQIGIYNAAGKDNGLTVSDFKNARYLVIELNTPYETEHKWTEKNPDTGMNEEKHGEPRFLFGTDKTQTPLWNSSTMYGVLLKNCNVSHDPNMIKIDLSMCMDYADNAPNDNLWDRWVKNIVFPQNKRHLVEPSAVYFYIETADFADPKHPDGTSGAWLDVKDAYILGYDNSVSAAPTPSPEPSPAPTYTILPAPNVEGATPGQSGWTTSNYDNTAGGISVFKNSIDLSMDQVRAARYLVLKLNKSYSGGIIFNFGTPDLPWAQVDAGAVKDFNVSADPQTIALDLYKWDAWQLYVLGDEAPPWVMFFIQPQPSDSGWFDAKAAYLTNDLNYGPDDSQLSLNTPIHSDNPVSNTPAPASGADANGNILTITIIALAVILVICGALLGYHLWSKKRNK